MYDMSKPIPYPNNPKELTLKNLSLDLYISVKKRIFTFRKISRFPHSFNSFPEYPELV